MKINDLKALMASLYPPVRYDGRCWIRVGPRKSIANLEEERMLTERRAAYAKTFDLVPVPGASVSDLSEEHFKLNYLPNAIDKDILRDNGRSTKEQLASLRFFDWQNQCPTNAGILLFGINPEFFLPGAYIHVSFPGEVGGNL